VEYWNIVCSIAHPVSRQFVVDSSDRLAENSTGSGGYAEHPIITQYSTVVLCPVSFVQFRLFNGF